MFQEGKDYKVIRKDREYVMCRDYSHKWLQGEKPVIGKFNLPRKKNSATFRKNGITLHKGFKWNGSNIVPDSRKCMRASAIHDARVGAMRRRIYEDSENNWDRGAREYEAICLADGMGRRRAARRRIAIEMYGEFKYPG